MRIKVGNLIVEGKEKGIVWGRRSGGSIGGYKKKEDLECCELRLHN